MQARDFTDELGHAASTTIALSTFFIFPLCVYYYLRSTHALAQELNCGDVFSMLDNPDCDELAKIAVMNVGTASADGFFCMVLVLSAIAGGLFAAGGRTLDWATRSATEDVDPTIRNPLVQLDAPLLSDDTASELSTSTIAPLTCSERILQINHYAGHWRRVGLGLGIAASIPYMIVIGQRILDLKGCDDNFLGLMWRGPIDAEQCPTLVTYYAMMSFSYPWTVSTWSAYLGWELSVIYQVMPAAWRCRLPQPNLNWLTSRLPHFFTAELKAHAVFWFKLVGLVTFVGAGYPVLNNGIQFANAALREYNCPSFFATVLTQHFVNTPECAPVFQILGVDAGVLKAEVFNAYPIALFAGVVALLLTAVVSTPVVYHAGDNPKLKAFLQRLDTELAGVLQSASSTAAWFLVFATLGFFCLAIPKANNLVDLADCSMIHYPSFAYFFDERCSAMTRSQANMVFMSMMWVVVSTSTILLGSLGIAGHVAKRSVTCGARLFNCLPRGYQALPSVAHETELAADRAMP